MKDLLTICLTILSFGLCAQPEHIAFQAKVYRVNNANLAETSLIDLLHKDNLLHKPSIVAEIGQDASLEIGNTRERMRIEFTSNKQDLTYTVNFSTKEQQDGGWLSMTYESPVRAIGSTSLIKSSLWQQHYIIQIESELIAN